MTIRLSSGATWKLNDFKHVPYFKRNLISVSQLASVGCTTAFSNNAWKVIQVAMVLAQGKRKGTLYMTARSRDAISVVKSSNESNLYHYRIGYI